MGGVLELRDGKVLRVPWASNWLGRALKKHLAKAGPMTDESKAKIRALSQAEIPIQARRGLYNGLNRRMKNPVGLKPGLQQKYAACISSKSERWKLLKEFLIDEDMSNPYYESVCASLHVRYRS